MAKDLVRTRRYIQKFYAMRTQLQAVSLRIQTLRSNQAMGEAMKGASKAMGLMNRSMNLPQVRLPLVAYSQPSEMDDRATTDRGWLSRFARQIQKIMMDFEKESATMDMKEEMMSDAVDDAMDQEGEDEEEVEGDRILKEVLDEIGVSIGQQVRLVPSVQPSSPLFAEFDFLSLSCPARRGTVVHPSPGQQRIVITHGHCRGCRRPASPDQRRWRRIFRGGRSASSTRQSQALRSFPSPCLSSCTLGPTRCFMIR